MDAKRKITVHVGEGLLDMARRVTRAGISETVRKGLELLAEVEAYDGLLKARGKVNFSIDLSKLREDRTCRVLNRTRRRSRAE
jgi:hypothetical protein